MSKRTLPKQPAETAADGEFMTTAELAEMMQTSPSNALAWRRDGVGPPYVKVGRYVRYRRSAVERWIAEQETNC